LTLPVVEGLVERAQDGDSAFTELVVVTKCLELLERLGMRRDRGDDLLELIECTIRLSELALEQPGQGQTVAGRDFR
jgi:hypothetical protein